MRTSSKFKRASIVFAGVMMLATNVAVFPITASAEDRLQPVALVKVDVQKLASGFRSTKIVGSSVVNDNNDSIGTVDDMIISSDDKAPYVVISVGGFLGMGKHMVAIPYDNLRIGRDKIVLPGATKDELKALPEFKYQS